MKPKSKRTEKDPGKDLKVLAKIPAKTRELLILQERSEKSIGAESIALNKMIRDKSR